jgi:phospholipase D1/2
VHLHYDNTQPVGASHHQKIVVIDDAMAFCGGLDPTCRRWDTCDHKAEHPLRTVDGKPYPPFHDHMMAVDGEAARALGDLARERWWRSMGKRLRSVAAGPEVWPLSLQPQLSDVNVAISRTEPQYNEQPGANEVERLYLDMVGAARDYIYIENQYFTASSIGDAIESSLKQPQGPEIIVVLRLLSHGWLEEMTMQMLRTKLIRRLRDADPHGRFHVYYPHIDGLPEGTCIDVHAKMILIDDEWLRIGSANLANRSMGLDSECDLTVAADGDPQKRATLRNFRIRLLAEHLGREPAQIEQAFARHMPAAQIIEQLKQPQRALLDLPDAEVPANAQALAAVADPEKPAAVDQFLSQFSPQGVKKKARSWRLRVGLILLAIIVLTALWEYTPLAQLASPTRIATWADEVSGSPIAGLMVLLAYTPACVVMFPRTLITLFAVVAFGPIVGFSLAMTGILIAATLTYIAGRTLSRETVLRLTRGRLDRLAQSLRSRGLMAVIALRLVPVAPFVVEGIVAGAIRIKLWQFELGTALGMLPGTLATTIFGGQLMRAIHDPHHLNYPWIAAAVLLIIAVGVGVRRWFVRAYAARRASAREGTCPG